MPAELYILLGTAISIALVHTLTGPDHYLPFIALAKTRGWSFGRTVWWTIICGCGHVWSSVMLGLGGAALGWSLGRISALESMRGSFAAWLMLCAGLLYMLWGLYRARAGKRHKHFDIGEQDELYVYEHRHGQPVAVHERHKVTPWVIFIIFFLGPCEPMIPLLFFPASQDHGLVMLLLILIYTLFTLLAMVVMVALGYFGLSLSRSAVLEKYVHALSGLSIVICAAGMLFLGW